MIETRFVAIPCKLSRGAFSGERVFTVQLADGTEYRSSGPRYFFWNDSQKLIKKSEPLEGEEIEGMVAARVIDYLSDEDFAVEIPNGDVIAVFKKQVHKRPTEIIPPGVRIPPEALSSNVPV